MTSNKRLHYFDVMKGIAIFMVVMGHVLTICIRDIDRAVLFKIIGQVHMPLFFFISGYFSYKVTVSGKDFAYPNLWLRFKQLIIPFMVVSTIWIYYFPLSGLKSTLDSTWHGLYFNEYKNGYWFTLCLFEIIMCYSVAVLAMRRTKSIWGEIAMTVVIWALIVVFSLGIVPSEIRELLGLELVFSFFPAFMYGVIARKHRTEFNQLTSRQSVYTLSLTALIILMYVSMYNWEFSFMSIKPVALCVPGLLHISLVVVAIGVVRPWVEKRYENGGGPSLAIRLWEYLGKESLAIYLLHYFFLFPMTSLQQPLKEMSLGFIPTFALSVLSTVLIISVTMMVSYIIQKSPLFGLLLTGKISKS